MARCSKAARPASPWRVFLTETQRRTGLWRLHQRYPQAGAAGTSPAIPLLVSGGAVNDTYNFQPENLILTPQNRGSVFTLGSFGLNDNIELYTEFLYNYTKSGYKIAPLPFDSRADNVVISEDSIYNPFGTGLGGSESGFENATWRMSAPATAPKRSTATRATSLLAHAAR